MSDYPPRARAYLLVVLTAGLLLFAVALSTWEPNNLAQFVFFLATTLLSALLKVRLPNVTGTMSLYFLMVLVAIPYLSWPEILMVACAATTFQTVWHAAKRPGPIQFLFNFAACAIATSGAHFVYRMPLWGQLRLEPAVHLGVAAMAYFFLSTVPFALVVALTENKRVAGVWRESSFWAFPYYLLGALIAGFLNFLQQWVGWQSTSMLAPILFLLSRSYRSYIRRLEDQKNHAEDMAALHLRTIESLALAIDAKDAGAHEHLHRMQVFSLAVGQEMGLDATQLEALRAAALLHDIGKLAVPEHIVAKPGKLTPEEFEKMKIHPTVGANILERVSFPYPVAPIVAAHHERWDGTGYPLGLHREEIPIGARILAAVDSLDALASERTYRSAMTLDDAMEKVAGQAGSAFDPAVVDILRRKYRELDEKARSGTRLAELAGLASEGRRIAAASGLSAEDPVPPAESDTAFLQSIAAARHEVQAMFEIAQDLSRSLSLADTLSVVTVRLSSLLPHDAVAVYLVNGQILRPEFAAGDDRTLFQSLAIPIGQGLSGWVAEHHTPICNGNPSVEPGYLNDPRKFSRLQSALVVPIENDGGLLGVLALYRAAQNAFTLDDQRVLLTVSAKLAVCVGNAQRLQRVENSASTDYLTGLPNARALFMHLHEEIARARRDGSTTAVLVGDLDGFKLVNDRFGHLAGNEVLRMVGGGLRSQCREYDVVARMGGDEFVVVMPGVSRDQALQRIDSLNEVAVTAGRAVCHEDLLGLSVGIAMFPDDGGDVETLLLEADKRMYKTKNARKGMTQLARAIQSAGSVHNATVAPAGRADR
jgi:diguanylate cyclase (GGDEF)-like protein/putative nucleotidyltransferase with HDIG domain